jgi:excisionase family DNA binding protein
VSAPAPQPGRLLYRVNEAAETLGISRSQLYELMTTGQLDSVKVGALRRIPADALQRFVDDKLAEARAES